MAKKIHKKKTRVPMQKIARARTSNQQTAPTKKAACCAAMSQFSFNKEKLNDSSDLP